MTYRHITTKNYMTYDIKFSHIVAALKQFGELFPFSGTHMHVYCRASGNGMAGMAHGRTDF